MKYLFCGAFIFLISLNSTSLAQETFDQKRYLNATKSNNSILTHKELLKSVEGLKIYHPGNFDSIQGKPIKEFIYSLELPTDSLNNAEMVYYSRKFFDYVTEEDPHFMITPRLQKIESYKVETSMMRVPPFWGMLCNDTLLVHSSVDEKIKQGDRILSINNMRISNILEYGYKTRFINIANLLWRYNFSLSDTYEILLQRGNEKLTVELEGIPYREYSAIKKKDCESKIYRDRGIAYFNLRSFTNNRKIFKQLSSFCKKIKKEGVDNLIIDLRENPGGSGYMFDAFLSLFSSKDSILVMKGGLVRASTMTKYYKFPKSDMGKIVSLPEKYSHRTVPLKSRYYVDGIKLFVLVSEYTFSAAASFANLIQFNEIGTLVGEPLKKNALKYGEIDVATSPWGAFSCSTVEFDEYSKFSDGIVRPDISIPYIAKEYMQGGDPMLEKLLEEIRKISNNK